jgi:hypothetical protein
VKTLRHSADMDLHRPWELFALDSILPRDSPIDRCGTVTSAIDDRSNGEAIAGGLLILPTLSMLIAVHVFC